MIPEPRCATGRFGVSARWRSAGHTDVRVRGDADVLALNRFFRIPIITPTAFVQGVGLAD
jgi:hypothetical protein